MVLSELPRIAVAAITIWLLLVIAMIQREPRTVSHLNGPGKWLPMAAFGMGVVALAVEIATATAIAREPDRVAGPILAAPLERRPADRGRRSATAKPAAPSRYVWEALPQAAPAPADNPVTAAKVSLGRRLFFETRLSGDGSVSCSSCHDLLEKAGADGLRGAIGIRGMIGRRNTPTVWNAAFQSVLFWDGRASSLEEQARGPILNPIEMGMASAEEAERRLSADASYRAEFDAAFGDDAISFDRIAKAIATFERTLITADSPYDRFVRGDLRALDRAQQRGMALFESVGCILCHKGPNFSDAAAIGGLAPLRLFPANATPYTARFDLEADGGAQAAGVRPGVWRVPSLRNVALTGPYFHNGSVDNLADAVRIMAAAQLGRTDKLTVWLDQYKILGKVDRSALGDKDVADLVAFLHALSSDTLAAAAADRVPARPAAPARSEE